MFRHLVGLGLDFFEREQTGRLVSRMTSDIDTLQELVQAGLTSMVQNLLLFMGAVVVIFVLSWQLALATLVVVPPVVWATRWFRRESNRAYLEVRERIGHNLATIQEGLAGVRVVQAFGQGSAYTERFRSTNEAQYEANIETLRISSRYFPFMESLGIAATAGIIALGGYLADQDVITVGTVAAFVLYLNNLFEPVQQLSQQYNIVQSSGAALHKLFALLDTEASIVERPGAVDLPASGAIEVTDVSFGYGENADVLHGVTLTIAAGERIALVGPTGAGKSTLAKLVARFYDPRSGTVAMGGVDLRDATLHSLRERIVVVPQEGFLFAGTVRENIRIGRADASDAEVDAAVDAIGLRERFDALPDGLATEVRERGLAPLGGGAPARVARPCCARGPRGPGARRGHVQPGSRHRARRRARARAAHRGPDGRRGRAPAEHRRARRPGGRRRRRRARRARAPFRAGAPRGPLCRPVRVVDRRGRRRRSLTRREQLRGGDGAQLARLEPVEDRGQRGDRAGVAEVQAHDRAGRDRGERALDDGVGAGILVVERVDVEAEHDRVVGVRGHLQHRVGGATVPSSVPDGRKNVPGVPASRASTSRQRTTSSSMASGDKDRNDGCEYVWLATSCPASTSRFPHEGLASSHWPTTNAVIATSRAASTSRSAAARSRAPSVWNVSATRARSVGTWSTKRAGAGAGGAVGAGPGTGRGAGTDDVDEPASPVLPSLEPHAAATASAPAARNDRRGMAGPLTA